MARSLQQQFSDCKDCTFALDRIRVDAQSLPTGEWEVELMSMLKRTLRGAELQHQNTPFQKWLIVNQINSAKLPAFEIEQIREIE